MTRPWVLATMLATLIGALILGTPSRAAAETQASGTAFVVHPDGLLLTCYHVVKESAKIKVTLGGRSYPAIVVGKDEKRDLAVLQIEASGLPFLPWVDARSVELGEEVRAFGFPLATELGTTLKVTRGTVSGVELEAGEPVFQVDSVVNPGNSGGPLVNERGQVVGVVVARFVEAISFGYVAPVTAAAPLLHGAAPEAGARSEKRLDGPALVRAVAPAIARVTAVPLSETGPLPRPFIRALPTSRPPAPAPPEKPLAVTLTMPVQTGTPGASPNSVPPTTAAEPQLFPKGDDATAPKPEVKPLGDGKPAPAPSAPPVLGKAKSPEGSGAASTVAIGSPVRPMPEAAPTPKPVVTSKEPTPSKHSAPEAEAEKAAMEVDNALCRIRSTDPPDFPQPVAEAVVTDDEKSEWTIANPNAYRLTIYLRGPERRSVVVEPGRTEKIMLPPGKYEVAAELSVDNVTPFYGVQEFGKGTRYRSRFRVEF